MIIIDDFCGRLGNRLFQFSHLMAFALENGQTLVNPNFREYSGAFPWFDDNGLCSYPEKNLLSEKEWKAKKFLQRLGFFPRVKWQGLVDLDFENPGKNQKFVDRLKTADLLFYEGWTLRGYRSLIKHKEEILRVLSMKPEYRTRAEEFIKAHRSGKKTVVGVHVRWEDYRGSENFFELDQFVDHMKAVDQLMGHDVCFVVCSNEVLPNFPENSFPVVVHKGNLYEDMSVFASCDFIVGPPSTFAGWASFSRGIPYYMMKNGQVPDQLDKFQVWQG